MRQLVNPRHKELSVRAQTELLEIPRSTLYYKPIGESPDNLEINMHRINDLHQKNILSKMITTPSFLIQTA